MYTRPTRAVPAGCVLGLFGVAAFVYAALSSWALYLALNVPAPHHDSQLVRLLLARMIIACVTGVALIWFGWRLACRADMSDPADPQKPIMRL